MFSVYSLANIFDLPAFERFRKASPKLTQTPFHQVRCKGRPVAVDRRMAAKARAVRRAKRLGQA